MVPIIIISAAILLAAASTRRKSRPATCPKLTPGSGRLAGYNYIETTTGGADLSDRLPIIILFHGRGANPKSMTEYLEDIPDRARVIIPIGNLGSSSNPLWFELRAATKDQDTLAHQMLAESKKVSTFIREANRCLNGVGKPIIAGHSQGGMMSLAVAANTPELARGVIAVSAWLPVSLWPMRLPITHLVHGEGDSIVDYSRTADFAARAQAAGLPIDIISIPEHGHGLSGDMKKTWLDLIHQALNG